MNNFDKTIGTNDSQKGKKHRTCAGPGRSKTVSAIDRQYQGHNFCGL